METWKMLLFEHEYAFARPGQERANGASPRPAADHHCIVSCFRHAIKRARNVRRRAESLPCELVKAGLSILKSPSSIFAGCAYGLSSHLLLNRLRHGIDVT